MTPKKRAQRFLWIISSNAIKFLLRQDQFLSSADHLETPSFLPPLKYRRRPHDFSRKLQGAIKRTALENFTPPNHVGSFSSMFYNYQPQYPNPDTGS